MPEFSLSYLLAPLVIAAALATLFLFFNLYHLWQYGIEGTGTRLLMLGYIAAFGITALAAYGAISSFSYEGTVTLQDILPLSSSSNLGL